MPCSNRRAANKRLFQRLAPLCLALLCAAPATASVQTGQRAWLNEAKTLEKRGDWLALLELGRRWTGAEAGDAFAWFVLGRAQSALDRPAEAAAAYERALALDPGDARAGNNLGDAYHRLGRHRDALLAWRQAVRSDPDYLPAWRNLGQTYYRIKGQRGVVEALREARRIDPDLASAWSALLIDLARARDDARMRAAIQDLRARDTGQLDRLFDSLLPD